MRRLTQRKWPCLAPQVRSSSSGKQVAAPHTERGPSTAGPRGPGGLHNERTADPQGPGSVLKIRRGSSSEGFRVLHL